MKIVGWAQGSAGQAFYRIATPMWALGIAGHDTTSIDATDLVLPEDMDVLVGQIVVEESRNTLWQEMAARPDRRFAMIFEIDDDAWALNDDNAAKAYYTEERIRTLERNIAVSDAVTVSTRRLAEIVGQFNPNVYVLPNCIHASLILTQRPVRPKLTIGWAGGNAHGGDFASVTKELRTFFRRNVAVESHLIGVKYSGLIGRPRDAFTAWSKTPEEYYPLIDFDIAIAPLAHNNFNRAKSDLKFLEYAALGIPVVATDFGPYSESIEHGVTGFLAKGRREWGIYLQELVNNPQLRAEIGSNARKWAATRTIHGNYGRWEQVYADVLARVRATAAVPSQVSAPEEAFAK